MRRETFISWLSVCCRTALLHVPLNRSDEPYARGTISPNPEVEGYNLGQKCAILALNSTINAVRYNQKFSFRTFQSRLNVE